MPGGIQGGGGCAGGDGFAGTDFTGQHSQRALLNRPAQPGDGFGVPAVAVQHRGGQTPPERHTREPVVGLQTLDTHRSTSCRWASLRVSLRSASRSVGSGWGEYSAWNPMH